MNADVLHFSNCFITIAQMPIAHITCLDHLYCRRKGYTVLRAVPDTKKPVPYIVNTSRHESCHDSGANGEGTEAPNGMVTQYCCGFF